MTLKRKVNPIAPGYRCGHLTAMTLVRKDKTSRQWWQWRCDCGKIAVIDTYRVKNGIRRHWGCLKKRPHTKMLRSGQRFGRLVVIEKVGHTGQLWLFKCDCGKLKATIKSRVTTGLTRSCGCLSPAQVSRYKRTIHQVETRLIKSSSNKPYGSLWFWASSADSAAHSGV